jgi:hypothetical protein
MENGRLDLGEQGELRNLLLLAFPVRAQFDELMAYRLGRNPELYGGNAEDYRTVLRKVIQEANAQYWWRDVVAQARLAVPADPALLAFEQRVQRALVIADHAGAELTSATGLEHQIKRANSTFDVPTWLRRLGEIEGRVCRVEYPAATDRGTGFLVASDLVLTNHHVVAPVIAGRVEPAEVALRFDYKVGADGVTVLPGLVHRLAADWLADHSPNSELDLSAEPGPDPPRDELDYALLRLAEPAGTEPVGGETDHSRTTPRGWIAMPAEDHDFRRQRALYIVQHPDGQPLKVALDTEAVIECNGNGTRVRYTTTTDGGSSGSPCFGPDWQWVALHHRGDPRYERGERPRSNQGIPVAAIRSLLAGRGRLDLLGK